MNLLETELIVRRTLIWALVYSIPAFQAMLPVEDADIWWHLRTGQWINEYGHVPAVDPFSIYGIGKPWVAYSWLFEVIIYSFYTKLGLVGIVIFTLVMSLLVALVVHLLVRRANLPFVEEVALTALAFGSMKSVISPRSWLFSMLFFAIELLVLFQVRRTGKSAVLWVLPPIFALWANFHIQFIYGLAAIGFLVAEAMAQRVFNRKSSEGDLARLPLKPLFLVTAACVMATFATPYHFLIVRPIVEISLQTGVFSNVQELLSLSFRSPADWFVLILVLIAVYVLGWERQRQLFPLLLLALGTTLGFRARRDVWVSVIAAVAVISEFRKFPTSSDSFAFTKPQVAAIAVTMALFTYLIGSHRGITNQRLEHFVGLRFPMEAANFVVERGYPGPLFNNFAWGGYLIWQLPNYPVSIDNRGNVHGDQRIERSIATWSGAPGWGNDPDLLNARLVIGQVWRPLVALLRFDHRFKLVYEDSTAAVFIAVNKEP